MTVSELIKTLQHFPGDARVVVDGYEEGVDDVARVTSCLICLNANTEWWRGDHEVVAPEVDPIG